MNIREFKQLVDIVFEGPNGKELLKVLKDEYCGSSCVRQDTHLTYYTLGQKELVEFLTQVKEDPRFLESLDELTNRGDL